MGEGALMEHGFYRLDNTGGPDGFNSYKTLHKIRVPSLLIRALQHQ